MENQTVSKVSKNKGSMISTINLNDLRQQLSKVPMASPGSSKCERSDLLEGKKQIPKMTVRVLCQELKCIKADLGYKLAKKSRLVFS